MCVKDALAMSRQTGCDGVAVGRGCQGRPWLFADIRNAFAGSSSRTDPDLGQVSRVIMRHAQLLTEYCDGDEQMAVRDLRKHIAWYLKGFPVGGHTRSAFMCCESLADVRRELDRLDPGARFPRELAGKPRGRTRYARKVHLPYGWLESHSLTDAERANIFEGDVDDASY